MRFAALIALIATALPAFADSPVVEAVEASRTGDSWTFHVTVRHADTGWEHYADGWSVIGPDGTEYGYRKLLHPHETEQPFRRSLSGVEIPEGVTEVIVRAHDNVHGWGADIAVSLE